LENNLHIKNKNCKIHAIKVRKKKLQQKSTKTKNQRKIYNVLGGRDLFCATKCATMKESDVPLLDNHTINERKSEYDAKENLNNKVDEVKNNPKKI